LILGSVSLSHRARVNLALLGLLAGAFLTGWLAFSYATAPARWALVAHASAGVGILLLLPWKSMIARRGLRRPRPARWASIALGVLVLVSIAGGLLHSSGALVAWGAYTAMELHVGAAIAAVPFAAWHVLARPVRVRPSDLSRRLFLRTGAGLALASVSYAGGELALRASSLPGAGRRFTGSYEVGSFDPDAMPVSSWMFDAVPTMSEHVKSGRVKALGTTGKTRSSVLPNTPTLDEAGVPGYEAVIWLGIMAPKGTPPAIVGKLNAAVAAALAEPAVRARLAELGQDIFPPAQQTPQTLGALQRAEIEKWWPVIKAAGIKPE